MLTLQPLFTFASNGEKIDESGVTHVYMPSSDVSYFGYGKLATRPLSPFSTGAPAP